MLIRQTLEDEIHYVNADGRLYAGSGKRWEFVGGPSKSVALQVGDGGTYTPNAAIKIEGAGVEAPAKRPFVEAGQIWRDMGRFHPQPKTVAFIRNRYAYTSGGILPPYALFQIGPDSRPASEFWQCIGIDESGDWKKYEPTIVALVTPRCGQTWRAGDGLEGRIFDENPPRQFHLRMSTAERTIVHAQTFAALTFVSGPTTPETSREAFERVVKLEAANVPDGIESGAWLGMILNRSEGSGTDGVRWVAARLRLEHAEKWQAWGADRKRER